jgi:hypothetical protein
VLLGGWGLRGFLRGCLLLLRGCLPLLRGCLPLLRGCLPLLRGCLPLLRGWGLLPPPPGLLLGCRFIAVSSFFCTEATILGLVVVVAVVVVAVVVAMVCSCINEANGRVLMSGEFLMMVLVRSSVGSSSVVGELGCWSVEMGDGGRVLSSASSSESRGMGRNVPPSCLRRRLSCVFSSLWASMSGLLGPCTSLNLSPSSSR